MERPAWNGRKERLRAAAESGLFGAPGESRGGGGGWGAGAGGVVLLCARARLGTAGGLPGGQVPETSMTTTAGAAGPQIWRTGIRAEGGHVWWHTAHFFGRREVNVSRNLSAYLSASPGGPREEGRAARRRASSPPWPLPLLTPAQQPFKWPSRPASSAQSAARRDQQGECPRFWIYPDEV